MIDWRTPEMFWALALVPLAVLFFVWALRRRQQALERFAEARLLPTIAPDHDRRRQWWRAAVLLASLTLLIVALAGPRWGFQWEEVRRQGIDIIVAIDTSRSMLAEDVKPNRLERAKLAVHDLVKQLDGDRIGLVPFAGSAFVQCPLTLDYEAFTESLRAVTVGIIPKGGTALADAIATSIEALEGRQSKHEAIILITDGEDHEGKIDDVTRRAAEQGIKIYTVGIGTADGELIPVTVDGQQTFLKDRRGQVIKSRLDDDALKQVAMTTGGAYVRAEGPSLGLDTVYQDYIAKMEKRELKTAMQRRAEDRFQLPLAAALVLLLVEPFIGNRRRRTARVRLPWQRNPA